MLGTALSPVLLGGVARRKGSVREGRVEGRVGGNTQAPEVSGHRGPASHRKGLRRCPKLCSRRLARPQEKWRRP